MITRRAIFGLTAIAAAAAAVDPERLLWVPRRKVISIPTGKVFQTPFVPVWLPCYSLHHNDEYGRPVVIVERWEKIGPGGVVIDYTLDYRQVVYDEMRFTWTNGPAPHGSLARVSGENSIEGTRFGHQRVDPVNPPPLEGSTP